MIGNLMSEYEGINDVYKELALLIGIENARKVFEHFGGQQITFPVKWLSKDYVAAIVIQRYDGKNMKQLAKEYGYSERWLRQIINDKK